MNPTPFEKVLACACKTQRLNADRRSVHRKSLISVLAASQMSGAKRRALEAEVAMKYRGGSPLLAKSLFGWGRQTVALGLAERRTGLMCLGAQAAFSGRKRWEDQSPQGAAALGQLADAHA
jgi:hypothetical protein